MLLRAAQASVPALSRLPLPDGVKAAMMDEFLWLTAPNDRERRWLTAGTYEFSALCKLATLRRFAAGQLHWEVAGLSRATLRTVPVRSLPALLRGIRALGGFRPAFVPHLAWRRRQIVLSEREHYRSLFRMAQALRHQPDVLGYVGEAWFYSADTHRVSPHLAWTTPFFESWGGTVLVSGPADERSGVFEGARARRELADAGAFRPTLGLVLWPRAGMLEWATHVRAEFDPTVERELVS
jgi:hypothetical protein